MEMLDRLLSGNKRFVEGDAIHPNQGLDRRAQTEGGQKPFAAILGCADSRVSPEIVFDQGVGDLFVTRVAGNVVNDMILGSLEYAVEHLGVTLILVLGHEQCGAVKAAMSEDTPQGHLQPLLDAIRPALPKAKGQPGDPVFNLVLENVRSVVEGLKNSAPVLAEKVRQKNLDIKGAVYKLKTGRVEIVDP